MFAKIAYAFTVRVFGLDNIEEAYVVEAILGKTDDVGEWVGCDGQKLLQTAGEQAIGQRVTEDREVEVRIRLFSFIETPEYVVIVGRVRDPQQRLAP